MIKMMKNYIIFLIVQPVYKKNIDSLREFSNTSYTVFWAERVNNDVLIILDTI